MFRYITAIPQHIAESYTNTPDNDPSSRVAEAARYRSVDILAVKNDHLPPSSLSYYTQSRTRPSSYEWRPIWAVKLRASSLGLPPATLRMYPRSSIRFLQQHESFENLSIQASVILAFRFWILQQTLTNNTVPTLFSSDLPPCGLIPQLAYENIVHHLRKVWLKRAIEHPVNNIRVFDICKEVHQDLWAEAERQPIDSQLGTKARRPWRREDVFKYEISWAAYLMKESEMLEMRPKLNEKELDRLQFLEKMFPIPKALGIEVKNNLNKTWVFDLWKAWHHKKRGTEPQDGTGLGIGGARDDDEEDAGRSEDVVSGDEGRTEGAAGTA
jgi:hypothetical protein